MNFSAAGQEQIRLVENWIDKPFHIFLSGSHSSSGHLLPVISISDRTNEIVLRNNFYDWNIGVRSEISVSLDLPDFATHHDKAWYEGEIDKCRKYTWSCFTDEEMNDPRILRVKNKYDNWIEVSGEKKDNWLDRYKNTKWYEKNWSNCYLYKIDEDNYWRAERAFCEGMDIFYNKSYFESKKFFVLAIQDKDRTMKLVQKILKQWS